MTESKFKDIVVASEVLQDGIFDLIDAGVVKLAAGTAFSLSDKRVKSLAEDLTKYQDRIVFRPQEISNNPEVIRRLGIISFNTALDRKSTRLNSSHVAISYAVFCLKKKNNKKRERYKNKDE